MLSWLFKKYGRIGSAAAPATGTSPATKARNAAAAAATAEAQAEAQRAARDSAKAAQAAARVAEDWPGQLQRALGDDTALLQLASAAPGLDTKLAAVEALASEDALRQAERAFRTRDRKVHRLAKARLDTAALQRTSRSTALQLLERGEALLQDPLLPVNHLVTLDRDWQALPGALLEPGQSDAYTALRARLDAAVHARAEADQHLQRWTAQVRQTLADGSAELAAAATHQVDAATPALDSLHTRAQSLRDSRPPAASAHTLDAALASLLQAVAEAQARLDALRAATPIAAGDADGVPADIASGAAETAAHGGPPDALTADPAAATAGVPQAQKEPAKEPPKERKATPEQGQQLQALLDQADTALADGQLAALQRHLQAADALQAAHKRLAWPTALRARQQALRAEQLRLKSWQSWGGTRARDDLVAQAEALARVVQPLFAAAPDVAAPDVVAPEVAAPEVAPLEAAMPEAAMPEAAAPEPDAPAAAPEPVAQVDAIAVTEAVAEITPERTPGTVPESAPASAPASAPPGLPRVPRPKLNLRAHANAIHDLRMRWKALDKQGDGAHGTLWQRFDAALTTAYEPVAAQQAVQQAARQQNMAARLALLDGLDAAALPPATAAADAAPAARGNSLAAWRDTARQLDAFQHAWRQLGPLEHTVPGDARAPLQQRLDASLERLDQPLRAVREQAVAQREQLVQRAEALLAGDGRTLHGGELQRQLRELQADWQDHARALPLPRGVEAALWNRFRAATDAVFAQRNAAAAAREAEQAAEVAEREALISQLTALDAQASVALVERTLADVHRAWLAAPAQLPRSAGLALQVRFDAATAAAAALTAAAGQARWQAQIDAWMAPLQASATAADSTPPAAPPASSSPVDDLLLQLEIALDLPAAPEWQAARRQLKLRALKEAMEGRTPPPGGTAPAAGWLATLLNSPALDAQQQQRLLAALQALRAAPPGTLGVAVPAG